MRPGGFSRCGRVLSALSFLCAPAALAQPAYRVKDINPAVQQGAFGPTAGPAALGLSAFFGAESETDRSQLWKSDGEVGGTSRLKSFPPSADGPPRSFTTLGGVLCFFTNSTLWRTDGTDEGTVLVRHFAQWGWSDAVVLGDAMYFTADDGVTGLEVWRSDGTEAGTVRVADVEPGPSGSSPALLTPAGGAIYFFAVSTTAGGMALWKTDGTAAGTVVVHPLADHEFPGSAMTALGDRIVFVTGSGAPVDSYRLWISDGSESGTAHLRDFVPDALGPCPLSCPPYGPSDLTALSSVVVFIANDGVHGREIWKTDGTPAGTALVRDVRPGPESGLLFGVRGVGNRAFFGADDGEHGIELWTTDGTEAGTRLVKDAAPGAERGTFCCDNPTGTLGGRLYYGAPGGELWSSDGTEVGTHRLRDLLATGDAYLGSFVSTGDELLFFVTAATGGPALWRTDGSEAGTVLLDDFPTGVGSHVAALADGGGTLYLSVPDPLTGRPALWKSDGTEAGTQLIRPFLSIGGGIGESLPEFFAGSLYFSADDGTTGTELWRTDGTEAGTSLVKDFLPGVADSGARILGLAGGRLFLAASDSTRPRLYVSDGTEAGTRIVGAVSPGGETVSAAPLGNVLIFAGDDGARGQELWSSDGTDAGTFLVEDINPGPNGSGIFKFAEVGGALFFSAYDGVQSGLWKTDGTSQGTVKVRDFGGFFGGDLTAVGNRVFFSNPSYTELWTSDGTPGGTFAVRAVTASHLTRVGGLLFFAGNDGVHGVELWRSDGTEAGTTLVRDIFPGPFGSIPLASSRPLLIEAAGRLVFAADDGEHGAELWVSDGTSAGTFLLQDINPGIPSSLPAGFAVSGARVFFTADDGVSGSELWAVALADLHLRQPRVLTEPPLSPRHPSTVPKRP